MTELAWNFKTFTRFSYLLGNYTCMSQILFATTCSRFHIFVCSAKSHLNSNDVFAAFLLFLVTASFKMFITYIYKWIFYTITRLDTSVDELPMEFIVTFIIIKSMPSSKVCSWASKITNWANTAEELHIQVCGVKVKLHVQLYFYIN